MEGAESVGNCISQDRPGTHTASRIQTNLGRFRGAFYSSVTG